MKRRNIEIIHEKDFKEQHLKKLYDIDKNLVNGPLYFKNKDLETFFDKTF